MPTRVPLLPPSRLGINRPLRLGRWWCPNCGCQQDPPQKLSVCKDNALTTVIILPDIEVETMGKRRADGQGTSRCCCVVSPAADALYCPKCMVAVRSVAYVVWYRTYQVLAGMVFFLFRQIF